MKRSTRIAVAANAPQEYSACVTSGKTLSNVTIGAAAHCASPAKRITWNSQGPHGLPGAKGTTWNSQGPHGLPGAKGNTGSARAGGGAGTPGIAGGGGIKGSNGGSTSVASASTLLLSDGGGLGGGDATNQNLAGAGGSPSVEAGVTTLSANAGANGNTATGSLNCPTNPDIPGSGGGIAGVAGSGAPAAWGCATPSPPEWC